MNLLGLILFLGLGAVDDPSPEFHQDFRNKNIADLKLKLTKPDHANLMKFEPEGVRITVPGDKRYVGAVGFLAPAPIKGDFEITASYEIIQADRPTGGGFGVGLELYMKANSPKQDGIGIYRTTRDSGKVVFSCTQMTTNDKGQRTPIRGSGHGDMDFPTSEKAGKLRITRIGSKVLLSAAEDRSNDFQPLYHMDFVPDDLLILSLGAHAGGAPNPVELRLVDLRIHPIDSKNQDVVKAMDSPPGTIPTEKESPPRKSWLWVLALLFAVSLAFGGLLIWWRKSQGDKKMDENGDELNVQTEPEEPAPPIFAKCRGCGKKLKAKAELAGRKVKCSQCGQVVTVPMNN